MSNEFFPAPSAPRIYAYSDSRFAGCLKVGYTTKLSAERVAEQYPVKLPNQSYTIVLDEIAMREDGSLFTDHDVHRVLVRKKIERIYSEDKASEWFKCDLNAVQAAILEIKTGRLNEDNRTLSFGLRPEQAAAVDKAVAYFDSYRAENPDSTPHFLWNAKMRFGKTFAAYQLAKK